MKYRMIVRQTMFDFSFTGQGRLRLRGVRFLPEETMEKRGDLLMVRQQGAVQFFLSGDTPLAELTREQFRFVAAVTRFFGLLPNRRHLPVWLWAERTDMRRAGTAATGEPVPAC